MTAFVPKLNGAGTAWESWMWEALVPNAVLKATSATGNAPIPAIGGSDNSLAQITADRQTADRVMPSNTNDAGMGAASNITIRKSDLETIAAAIQTQVNAGTMTSVTMPEFATTTWWAQ